MPAFIKSTAAILIVLQSGSLTTKIHENKYFDVELIDYGVYEFTRVELQKADKTAEGRVWEGKESKLLFKTDEIPMKLLTSFGIRCAFRTKLAGNEITNIIPIQVTIRHPKFTFTDTGRESTKEEWISRQSPYGIAYIGYKFDHEYEMVPGEWIFELRYKDVLLVEKKFIIQQPAVDMK